MFGTLSSEFEYWFKVSTLALAKLHGPMSSRSD